MKFGSVMAGLSSILKAGRGCPTHQPICSLHWETGVTFSIFPFFYDSDLIGPHLYSSLKSTASEAILKTQHSPKGPNPTPIQINSLQWSLFVASQQD